MTGWPEVVAGALTGLVVGLTGVGGGALMTPILLLVFGVSPVTAIGTDLWFAALTKSAAVPLHHGRGLIDWPIIRRLWMGSLPAALAAVMLLKYGVIGLRQPEVLKAMIAAAVIVTAVGMICRRSPRDLESERSEPGNRFGHQVRVALTIATGILIGFLVTLTSVGAGALGAVFLTILYPARLTPSRLVATDLVHAIPLAIFSGAGHLLIGHVDAKLLVLLLTGSIPGVLVGAKLSHLLPQGILKWIIAMILMAVGVRLWLSL